MLRALRRFGVSSSLVWCAALAGALFGAVMSRPRASACECSPPEWRLTLNSESTSSEDLHAWPRVARLEARSGTVVFWSEEAEGRTAETIDYVHAGEP